MCFHYKPTFSDYWSILFRVLCRRIRILIWVAVLGIVALVFAAWLRAVGDNRDLALLCAFCAGGWFPAVILRVAFGAAYRAAKKRWAEAPDLREERDYTIDETGIGVRSAKFTGVVDWAVIKTAAITKQFVFLTTVQGDYYSY
jgi:hypothetical protein